MHSLKQVINALRREIEGALAQDAPLPSGVVLEASKAVVTLNFQLKQSGAGDVTFAVPQVNEEVSGLVHSVTVEFARVPSTSNNIAQNGVSEVVTQISKPRKVAAPSAPKVDFHWLTEQLSAVFGAPGFDSSARADVFREALESLSEEQAVVFPLALQGTAHAKTDAVVTRAISLIHRVCQSGPSGPVKGKAILAEVFQKYPLKAIVSHVATVWKSQQDWMDS